MHVCHIDPYSTNGKQIKLFVALGHESRWIFLMVVICVLRSNRLRQPSVALVLCAVLCSGLEDGGVGSSDCGGP